MEWHANMQQDPAMDWKPLWRIDASLLSRAAQPRGARGGGGGVRDGFSSFPSGFLWFFSFFIPVFVGFPNMYVYKLQTLYTKFKHIRI